jgi:hypothetical protein
MAMAYVQTSRRDVANVLHIYCRLDHLGIDVGVGDHLCCIPPSNSGSCNTHCGAIVLDLLGVQSGRDASSMKQCSSSYNTGGSGST